MQFHPSVPVQPVSRFVGDFDQSRSSETEPLRSAVKTPSLAALDLAVSSDSLSRSARYTAQYLGYRSQLDRAEQIPDEEQRVQRFTQLAFEQPQYSHVVAHAALLARAARVADPLLRATMYGVLAHTLPRGDEKIAFTRVLERMNELAPRSEDHAFEQSATEYDADIESLADSEESQSLVQRQSEPLSSTLPVRSRSVSEVDTPSEAEFSECETSSLASGSNAPSSVESEDLRAYQPLFVAYDGLFHGMDHVTIPEHARRGLHELEPERAFDLALESADQLNDHRARALTYGCIAEHIPASAYIDRHMKLTDRLHSFDGDEGAYARKLLCGALVDSLPESNRATEREAAALHLVETGQKVLNARNQYRLLRSLLQANNP